MPAGEPGPPSPERLRDLGGTLRTVEAAVTLRRARRVFGAVGITRVADVTGLDHVGVPTWMVVRPLARSLSVSQGKGASHELAAASGVMEAIEIHHAERFVPAGERATLAAARRDPACVDPLLLPVRSDAEADAAMVLEWIAGEELGSGRRLWVPREMVDLDFTDGVPRRRLLVASSNGLASGNSRSEALLHGLCEVIERDQVSFWLVEQRLSPDPPVTRVEPEGVDDPVCRWLLERIGRAGLEVAVWNATHRLRVPCFVALVFDRSGRTMYPQRASGYGCHPLRRIALSRALAEALQSRLTHIAGSRDDVFWARYRDELPAAGEGNARWLDSLPVDSDRIPYGAVGEAPALATTGELLEWVRGRLADGGLERAVAVDLTREGIDIPVVRIVVPGLEFNIRKPVYTPGPRMQEFVAELAAQRSTS